jgi:A/G-specific adenine glycosylase
MPTVRAEIEALPGVGQYIANAVQLFAHETPAPLLDVNMARVLQGHYGPRQLVDIRYDPYLQALAYTVVKGRHAAAVNYSQNPIPFSCYSGTRPLVQVHKTNVFVMSTK